MEEHVNSSQEHTGVEMAPTLDTKRTSGLAPREGSLSNSHPMGGVHRTATILQYGLQYKNGSSESGNTVSTSGQLHV